ncbi:MAG: polysaccharide lyase family 7 protein [Pseudomonadota bacterium]
MGIRHLLSVCVAIATIVSAAQAEQLANGGFESGLEGWSVTDEARADVSLTGRAKSGDRALQINGEKGFVQRALQLEPFGHYNLTLSARGTPVVGVKVGDTIYFERRPNGRRWGDVTVSFHSGSETSAIMFLRYGGAETRYDDVTLTRTGPQSDQRLSAAIVPPSEGGTGLSPDLPPSDNFDLLGWNLSVPTDTDNNGRSDTISERELASGYQNPAFFYTGEDGGMVFRCPIGGFKTSTRTNYTRVELREMLRRGNTSISTRTSDGTPNKNNWVFSSAPRSAQLQSGGVDGTLTATLAVNHVTTTGERREVGRVIIGQIHAKDDEPIRLYYRKLPENERGAIYAAHENKNDPEDVYYDLIGSRAQSAPDPEDGIALGEKFSYRIDAKGNSLDVTIEKDGVVIAQTVIDMEGSDYDAPDDYMYFKAGVYNQNKTGDPDDYVQATFYALEASHFSVLRD